MIVSQTQAANDAHFDKTLTLEVEGNQSALDVLTPTSGSSIAIKGVFVTADGGGAANSYIQLHFADDENDAANTVLNTKIFASASGWISGYIPMLIKGDKDAPLKLTASVGTGTNIFILVNYREE